MFLEDCCQFFYVITFRGHVVSFTHMLAPGNYEATIFHTPQPRAL